MSALSIQLFGKFSVRSGEQALSGLNACKEQELLSYLLVHRARPHPRETLAALLWGDCSTEKSKKYLRQALWHLQSALDATGEGGGDDEAASCERPGALVIENEWVQFNAESDCWLDVAVFECAYAVARETTGRQLESAQAGTLREAVALYRGDLLEGCYQDWCLYERERLQNMYLSMLDKLLNYSEAHEEYETGQTYGALILRHDRARERTHRQLMHLHYRAGDRTAALRQYERCAAALDQELGVRPDARTQSLYRQICADQLEAAQPAQADAHRAEDAPAAHDSHAALPVVSLPEVLGRLQHLQKILDDVQQQIRRDIKAVELTLNTRR